MLGRIFTVGGYTLLSRLTGFARDVMLAAILGAGPMADAFFVAFRLPNHFRAIFAEGAFNAAFVPAYAHVSGGMLNVMHRFASAAAASIFLNLAMMMTLALAAFFPTAGHAAAWGVLISGFLQYFLLAGDLSRHGGLPRVAPLKLDQDVSEFF